MYHHAGVGGRWLIHLCGVGGVLHHQLLASARLPLVIANEIRRDGRQPGTRIIGQSPASVKPRERILRQVLGQLRIAGQAIQVAEQRCELRVIERRYGVGKRVCVGHLKERNGRAVNAVTGAEARSVRPAQSHEHGPGHERHAAERAAGTRGDFPNQVRMIEDVGECDERGQAAAGRSRLPLVSEL